MSFTEKVVIVTGASSGIGAATAILFAKEGANVVIVGRNETKLKNVAAKIQEQGKKPLVIKADVSKDDDAKRVVQETVDNFGKLDVLINNAGMMRPASLLNGTALTAFDELVGTNLRAVIHLMSLATPHLVKTKGNIVNISSMTATGVESYFMSYGCTKAALDHFSRCAASELADEGVRVNIISPGPVRTDIIHTVGVQSWEGFETTTALNRISEPVEIADIVLFVASDKAKGVTGSVFVIDNGTLVKSRTPKP